MINTEHAEYLFTQDAKMTCLSLSTHVVCQTGTQARRRFSMWAALIPIILQLLQFLLPLFFKRLNEFVGKLDESKTARQMFRKANPTTFEEFQAIWPAICEQVVADAASRPQARRLESVKPRFLKPKFMRAAWTRLVATGKFPACTTAPDLSLNELIAESKED